MDPHAEVAPHEALASTPNSLRRRLGRGLSALLGGAREEPEVVAAAETDEISQISVSAIDRNPFQPRKDFAEEPLQELAESIQQHGMLQPLLVRPHEGRFQLVAGERRWLAAQRAGLSHVPCRVLELDDRQVYEVAIEENVKRKDLGVLEKAAAFHDYLQRFGCSIEELAGRLSMSRANVSNYLRLLDLSEPVKEALGSGQISNGHARALLSLEELDQWALCQRIVAEGLSVRKTEEAVRELQQAREAQERDPAENFLPFDEAAFRPPAVPQDSQMSTHVLSLQEQLREILGAQVEIHVKGKDAGKIVIPFASSDEFERLLRLLRRAA